MSIRLRSVFMALVVLALLAGMMMLVTGYSHAADAPAPPPVAVCFPTEAAKTGITRFAHEHGVDVTSLTGEHAKAYLEALNAVPPETHLAGDAVMLVPLPDEEVAIWVVVEDHACLAGKVGSKINDRLMEEIEAGKA